jgi:hexosaminidase
VNIIPQPQEVRINRHHFILDNNTSIQINSNDSTLLTLASYVKSQILQDIDYDLAIGVLDQKPNAIKLILDDKKNTFQKNAYTLIVTKKDITIMSSCVEGLFYGIQSLIQLLPYELKNKNNRIKIPCVQIRDFPRFSWRGMHLDVARHYISMDVIKRYIDHLAFYKMNVLHLHLTDDQAWRLEIKKYPKLTEIGAWRNENDSLYGGYYTQENIREIVQYAAERYITIVPEIEMPGHCTAALAAYPQLSCTGGPFTVSSHWGIHQDVFCAGKEETFTFLENVLHEVILLFPSEYIHIGGDEVPKERWKNCPNCKERMKNEHIHNTYFLQSYFLKRISSFLRSQNKTMIGWEEIMEGGMPDSSILQVWNRPKMIVSACKTDRPVIVSLHQYTYFSKTAYYLPLHKVYDVDFIPSGNITQKEASFILGGECCLWTEYIDDNTIDSYMFPRLPAFAEVLWTNKIKKDFSTFYKHLMVHKDRLNDKGVHFGMEANPINIKATYNSKTKNYFVTLTPDHSDLEIHYCYSHRTPSIFSNICDHTLVFNRIGALSAQAYIDNYPYGNQLQLEFISHHAIGIAPTLEFPYHPKYHAGGKYGLCDGIMGQQDDHTQNWQGFEGQDMVAVIDLMSNKQIDTITTSYLHQISAWIFVPQQVDYYVSQNGSDYTHLISLKPRTPNHLKKVTIENFLYETGGLQARYVKVIARNIGICPEWHSGNGGFAWVFADEIIVK